MSSIERGAGSSLKNSLRTRIIVVFSMLIIAVQIVLFLVVNGTNARFQSLLSTSQSAVVTRLIPTLRSDEQRVLNERMGKVQTSLAAADNVTDATIVRAVAENEGSAALAVQRLDGTVLYSTLKDLDLASIVGSNSSDTGFFYNDSWYFSSSQTFFSADTGYKLTAMTAAESSFIPRLQQLTDTKANIVPANTQGELPAGGFSKALTERGDADIIFTPGDSANANLILEQQQLKLKIVLAGSLATVLIVAMALVSELTKPLKQLVEATQAIKNGDYSKEVPVLQKDEIGELASTIDVMRQRVAKREAEILDLAYSDSLTGLPNRALFDDRLGQAVAVSKRKETGFAVLMLDMNRFKYINDVLGHEAGDHVLRVVAERLRVSLRESDTVARLGGDEFALLLLVDAEADIIAAVQKITAVFEKPVTLNNQPVDIGCSIGISRFPEHGTNASTLMRRADMAMYSAKRIDKAYAFYDVDCNEHQEQHLTLLGEIKRAIEHDELQLFFQPKVTFGDSSAYSVETLLRWQHPERGLVPPNEFIPFAEQTGAIRLITRWLVDKALVLAGEWHRQGLHVKMSLNISARDLLDPDFADFVERKLKTNAVPPPMVCMEITESALMEDPIKARRTVEELHALGVSISIDDYGTGYSSLAYVKNLPVNELKIDREFIKNMLENDEDVAIVRSTIELGHNLGMKVVAEGIEHEAEMQMLREFGCDQGQGFLISKALPVSEMELWFKEQSNKQPPDEDSQPIVVGQN